MHSFRFLRGIGSLLVASGSPPPRPVAFFGDRKTTVSSFQSFPLSHPDRLSVYFLASRDCRSGMHRRPRSAASRVHAEERGCSRPTGGHLERRGIAAALLTSHEGPLGEPRASRVAQHPEAVSSEHRSSRGATQPYGRVLRCERLSVTSGPRKAQNSRKKLRRSPFFEADGSPPSTT